MADYPLLQDEIDLVIRALQRAKEHGFTEITIKFHQHQMATVKESNNIPPQTLALIYKGS